MRRSIETVVWMTATLAWCAVFVLIGGCALVPTARERCENNGGVWQSTFHLDKSSGAMVQDDGWQREVA